MNKGKTSDMEISKITLGTVQFGMDYGMNNVVGKPTTETSFSMLKVAFDSGINCIDTARDYGTSQDVIGDFLKKNPSYKENITVTKFKIDPKKGTSANDIEKQMRYYVMESLEKLGLEVIPIYLLHSAGDMTAYGSAVADTLAKLKAEGLIKMAGVSVYSGDEITTMLENPIYEAVQLPMSIFDQRLMLSGHLDKLLEANIIVFVRSIFLQGMVFMEKLPSKYAVAQPFLDELNILAKENDVSVAEIAVAYIRDLPHVTSLVLGAETAEQVKSNVEIIKTPPLADNVAEKIRQLAKDFPIEDIMKAIVG